MGNTQIFTPEKRAAFLTFMRTSPNVTMAARSIGLTRRAVYFAYEEEPDFAKEWDEAKAEGVEFLEAEAQRRAFEGTNKPVFHMGMQCGTVREYSDTLTIFLLKAHNPERFRENHKIDLGGALTHKHVTDDEAAAKLTALLAIAKQRESEDASDLV